MASTRVIPDGLRAAPVAVLILLTGWASKDVFEIADRRFTFPLIGLLVIGIAILVLAVRFHWTWIRPFGLAVLASVYVSAHAFFLGVQVVPSLVFLVLLICQIELRILAERFAPIYDASLAPEDRHRIRAALSRAGLRLIVAAALAIIVPIVAANLAIAGVVPVTTIPTAISLAIALVVVISVVALLPSLGRRRSDSSPVRTRGAKDN